MIERFLGEEGSAPSGIGPVFDGATAWVDVSSHGLIAGAMLALASALVLVARRRPDLNRRGFLFLFAIATGAAALTHVVAFLAPWYPLPAAEGTLKGVTAAIAVCAAAALWPALRRLLDLPTADQLALANARLEAQARDLERVVAQRTADLERRTEEYAEASARAREAQEIAERESRARDRFLATMSHELRTPLNAVLGFSELLTLRATDDIDPKSREYLDIVRKSARHLLSLIDEVLDYQRIVTAGVRLSIEPVPVADAIRSAVTFNRERIEEKALRLSVDVDEHLTARADRRALTQVCTNLIGNAASYCAPETRVAVAARTEGPSIVLEISDEGFGMDPEALDSVFKPFHRAHESVLTLPGTGLGLPTVRLLTTAMTGSIALTSEPGNGTTATVTLPLYDPPCAAARASPAGAQDGAGSAVAVGRNAPVKRGLRSKGIA